MTFLRVVARQLRWMYFLLFTVSVDLFPVEQVVLNESHVNSPLFVPVMVPEHFTHYRQTRQLLNLTTSCKTCLAAGGAAGAGGAAATSSGVPLSLSSSTFTREPPLSLQFVIIRLTLKFICTKSCIRDKRKLRGTRCSAMSERVCSEHSTAQPGPQWFIVREQSVPGYTVSVRPTITRPKK